MPNVGPQIRCVPCCLPFCCVARPSLRRPFWKGVSIRSLRFLFHEVLAGSGTAGRDPGAGPRGWRGRREPRLLTTRPRRGRLCRAVPFSCCPFVRMLLLHGKSFSLFLELSSGVIRGSASCALSGSPATRMLGRHSPSSPCCSVH